MDRLEVERAILVDRSGVVSGNIYYSKRLLPNFTFKNDTVKKQANKQKEKKNRLCQIQGVVCLTQSLERNLIVTVC